MSSRSIVTKPAPKQVLTAERRQYAEFAVAHSEPIYREAFANLFPFWQEANERFFEGKLLPPHLTIGQTPARCLGFYKPVTDGGSDCQITVNQAMYFGTHRIVVNRWPAEGAKRFVQDVVRHEMVHQYQWEILGDSEPGYRGHGPRFAER